MKNRNWIGRNPITFTFILLGTLLFLFFIVVGLVVDNQPQEVIKTDVLKTQIDLQKNIASGEQDILDNCANLKVDETAECLVTNVRTFFIYTKTDDSISLTFDQLKTNGGDCKDWSELYVRLSEELGFYGTTATMITEEDSINKITYLHVIAFISNSDGYCMLSQENYICYEFE